MRRTFIALCVFIALPLAAQTNVLISTDIAMGLNGGFRAGWSDPDDAWAITTALATGLNVRGIAVTYGNNYVAPEMSAMAAFTTAIEPSRKWSLGTIKAGAAVPLTNPQVAFGTTALNDACWNDGVEMMASTLDTTPSTIIGIGPVTDVGCMVLNASGARMAKHPKAIANIRNLILIMGRAPDEAFSITDPWTNQPHSGLSDFNYVNDPSAVAAILASKIPLTFMTFSLTKSSLVPRTAVEQLQTAKSPLAQFMAANTLPWIAQFQGVFGEPGFHPWDANAVWYTTHPDAYVCAPATYRVVTCGTAPNYADANNPCAGHGPEQPSSLNKESSQLWLSSTVAYTPRATACTAWKSESEKAKFLEAILKPFQP